MKKINVPLEDTEGRVVSNKHPNYRKLYASDLYLTVEWAFKVRTTEMNETLGMEVAEDTFYNGVQHWGVNAFTGVSLAWVEEDEWWQLEIQFTSGDYRVSSTHKHLLEDVMEMILEWHRDYLISI